MKTPGHSAPEEISENVSAGWNWTCMAFRQKDEKRQWLCLHMAQHFFYQAQQGLRVLIEWKPRVRTIMTPVPESETLNEFPKSP